MGRELHSGCHSQIVAGPHQRGLQVDVTSSDFEARICKRVVRSHVEPVRHSEAAPNATDHRPPGKPSALGPSTGTV